MVLKLLVFLMIVLFSLFGVGQNSEASNYAPLGYTIQGGKVVSSPTGLVPAYTAPCTITYTNDTFIGNANQTCGAGHQCRPVPGQGNRCIETPTNGSVANGSFCYTDSECQSNYCFRSAGVVGVSTCQTKCGPATCSGGCVVTINYLSYPTNPSLSDVGLPAGYPNDTNTCIQPTATPTPSDPCTTTSTSKPNNCTCQSDTNCASLYCSPAKTCQTRPAATATPTNTPTPRAATPTNTPTPVPACNPDGLGQIDIGDFNVWRDEYLVSPNTTKKSACMSPDKNTVDIHDFNAWRDKVFFNKQFSA